MRTNLKVELLRYTPEPLKTVACAAKLCYSKSGATDIEEGLTEEATEKFVKMLASMGHQSPLEHISFTFAVEGVSRALTHQLVRHRLASYSQQSQRYVSEGEFEYIVPPAISNDDIALYNYILTLQDIQSCYNVLRKRLTTLRKKELMENGLDEVTAEKQAEKLANEDARYILPNGCETKIVITMNARELIHFFTQRTCNRAQWEIRELATQMLFLVRDVCPILFDKVGAPCLNGKCPEGKMSCGKSDEVREKLMGGID